MSKIVIDARIINTSTGRYVERLLHYLQDIDHTNQYIVLVPTKDLNFYKPVSPRFKLQAADFANYSLAEQTKFLRFLNSLNADLVHFCMPQQPILYKLKHITTFHDLILLHTYNSDKNYAVFKAKQFVGRFVFKRVARTSAHIITPTAYVKNDLATFARIDPAKITVTYEGTDISKVEPRLYDPLAGKEFIMYVGQQSDYKNIRRLMQAHQNLRKKYPELFLVLVGRLSGKNGAPFVANREWAKQQGYQGIVYTDFLPDDNVRWLMEHTRAYVFPSLMEGFGLPALDAMAAGAPVASSNATCLPEVYGDAAEFFNPLDVVDMTSAIERILTQPARRAELIAKGKIQAAKYSWRRMAKQTHAVYKMVLKQQ